MPKSIFDSTPEYAGSEPPHLAQIIASSDIPQSQVLRPAIANRLKLQWRLVLTDSSHLDLSARTSPGPHLYDDLRVPSHSSCSQLLLALKRFRLPSIFGCRTSLCRSGHQEWHYRL